MALLDPALRKSAEDSAREAERLKAELAAARAERDTFRQLAVMMLARTFAGEMDFGRPEVELRGDLNAWDVEVTALPYGALHAKVIPRRR